MSGPQLDISIVVPTYQRRGVLLESLPTLFGQDLSPDGFEVVVVVDGSTDGSEGLPAELAAPGNVRTIVQENRGLSAARNRGAREARGRIVLFVDDDAHASPGLARAHLAAHEAPEGPRVVFGPFPLLARRRRSFLAAGVERWARDLCGRMARPGHKPGMRDFCFANASLPRSLWHATGGFEESFRRYGNEDLDYGLRLLAAGVKMSYAPDAIAWQDYRKTYADWLREWRDVGRADVGLWRRHPEIEADLDFTRLQAGHPLRRACFRAGLRRSRAAAVALSPVRAALTLADRWGLRGRPFDLLKWLPADFHYGRGVGDALEGESAAAIPRALRGGA